MKDTFAKREYKCKCGRITTDFTWQSLLEKNVVNCFKCGNQLTIKNIPSKVQVHSIRTDTKNR